LPRLIFKEGSDISHLTSGVKGKWRAASCLISARVKQMAGDVVAGSNLFQFRFDLGAYGKDEFTTPSFICP
jgi:hypothetical protein